VAKARETIAELKRRHQAQGTVSAAKLASLKRDPRRAARALARHLEAQAEAERREQDRLRRLLIHERRLWRQGMVHIAGVDEAGMAPLAGPVVAAAAILPKDFRHPGIDDSKVLDAETRDRLAVVIKANAIAWATGRAEVDEIDRLNIYWAGLLAMRRAVEGLSRKPDFVLVDARTIPEIPISQRGIIHGDALSLSIAAASIIAKTTRDGLMAEMDRQYPGYGLAQHKGYPTPEHLKCLRRLGPCPIHRRSFAPVKELLPGSPTQEELPFLGLPGPDQAECL
jgi:ribonuclease HII